MTDLARPLERRFRGKPARRTHVMVKPTGALCNLDCTYCYYLSKKRLFGTPEEWRIADEVLEAFIRQHFDAQNAKEVIFTWQRGEPTLLGLDFFRRVVALGKLHYVYNFLGIGPEQEFVSGPLAPGKYTLGMEFTREKAGEHHESIGTTKLYVGDKVVAQGPMKTQSGKFTLSGDGLCVGFDSGDAVSSQYATPAKFHGGRILGVGVSVEKTGYTDLEKEAQAAFARD